MRKQATINFYCRPDAVPSHEVTKVVISGLSRGVIVPQGSHLGDIVSVLTEQGEAQAADAVRLAGQLIVDLPGLCAYRVLESPKPGIVAFEVDSYMARSNDLRVFCDRLSRPLTTVGAA